MHHTGIAASRRHIEPFLLLRPNSTDRACALLAEAPEETVVLAGGIDLVNRMKAGHAPRRVVALNAIAALREIRVHSDRVEIGAAVSHWQIENHAGLREALPWLPAYVSGLGNIRIRVQGTIGGNVMAAEPVYEMLPLLAVLGAELTFFNVASKAWTTQSVIEFSRARPASLLLTSVIIPRRARRVEWDRTLRPGVGMVVSLDMEDDKIRRGTAALVGGRGGPVFAMHAGLADASASGSMQEIADNWAGQWPAIDPAGRLSADYCRAVGAVMLRRALTRASGVAA